MKRDPITVKKDDSFRYALKPILIPLVPSFSPEERMSG